MSARRKRADSTAFAQDVVAELAEGPPAWPALMEPPTPQERFAYEALVESRPFPPWTRFHLRLAADLAQRLVQIDELERRMRREGETLRDRSGRAYRNPLVSIIAQYRRMAKSAVKVLGLDVLSRAGSRRMDTRDLDRAALRAQQIRDDLASAARDDPDGLLALPDEVRAKRLPRKPRKKKPN